jgi:alpha-amylase/alpha-mannosidase (GH57 family)
MVRILRKHPGMRATCNVVPCLIEQLEAYRDGANDRHLELTSAPADSLSDDERREFLSTAFLGNPSTMLDPYPRLVELHAKHARDEELTISELRDLQVWSNLVWVAPVLRDEQPWAGLFAKGKEYTEDDKTALFEAQRLLCGLFVDELRTAHDDGYIEVSFSPYYHPILPLLCDTDVMRDPTPEALLPTERFAYPEDAREQIRSAREYIGERLGEAPVGMWPSEGSVSEEVVEMAGRLGVVWTASDEGVLRRSLERAFGPTECKRRMEKGALFRAHRHPIPDGPAVFFRDHALSDLIGFVYSSWEPEEAAENFVLRLREIRGTLEKTDADLSDHCATIILDGENAWEYYSDNGEKFLHALYSALENDPAFEPTTPSTFLSKVEPDDLPRLAAGSWINADFRVWLGHAEDRAAWEWLARVRKRVAEHERSSPEDKGALEAARRSAFIAEGSDWTWWYGDYHSSPDDAVFDELYRGNLIAALEAIGAEVPEVLRHPIGEAGLRRATYSLPRDLLSPTLDGRDTWYFEWALAGRYLAAESGGAMHRTNRLISAVLFGYDTETFYMRIDLEHGVPEKRRGELAFVLALECETERRELELVDGQGLRCVRGDIVEAAVPYTAMGFVPPCDLRFSVRVIEGGEEVERVPEGDDIRVSILGAGLSSESWIA